MLWYSQEHYLGASILWGLASSIRSNAIVYSGFFMYDLILKRIGKVIKKIILIVMKWKWKWTIIV